MRRGQKVKVFVMVQVMGSAMRHAAMEPSGWVDTGINLF
jgi:hypothetical protein